jgi:hypothetical protein
MVDYQNQQQVVENLTTSIQSALQILKQLDPDNAYLMDFSVDISFLRIKTGLLILSDKYAPYDLQFSLEGKLSEVYIKYTTIESLIRDLKKIDTIYNYYIHQNTSSLIHGFRTVIKAIQKSFLGTNREVSGGPI